MSTKAELACVYAALVLVDDDVTVTVSTLPWAPGVIVVFSGCAKYVVFKIEML